MTDSNGVPLPPEPGAPVPPAVPPVTPPAAPAVPTAPSAAPTAHAPAGPVPGRTMGIVALILAFFVQLVALILGIIALNQSKRAGVSNGPALWAIILSIVFMVLGIIIAIIVVATGSAIVGNVAELCTGLEPGVYELSDGSTVTCG